MKKVLLLCVLCLAVGGYSLKKFWSKSAQPTPPPAPIETAQAHRPLPPPPAPRVEPMRAWKFSQDDKIQLVGSGAVSVAAGGLMDATFLRIDGTNVVLKLIDGGTGRIALESLSEEDLLYVASLSDVVIDELATEAAVLQQKLATAQRLGDQAAMATYQQQIETASARAWNRNQAEKTAHDKAVAAARHAALVRRLHPHVRDNPQRRHVRT
jgi:hypothetical protein